MKITDLFYFTRSQRNGLIVLISLIIITWALYIALDKLYFAPQINYEHLERIIDSSVFVKQPTSHKVNSYHSNQKPYNKDTCRVNINNPDYNKLICIGVPENIAKIWINYIKKGGKFFSVNDVRKLWYMSDSVFYAIHTYLYVENKYTESLDIQKLTQKQSTFIKKPQLTFIDLNTADTSTLVKLPGIGYVFAKRIIKYRELLGGFYSIDQLKEVYGFTDEMFSKIKGLVYADVFAIKRIDLNSADFKKLISHPYLKDKNLVLNILNLRKKLGKYNNVSDILAHNIIDSLTFNKIKWYLECKQNEY
ncbi:MAG: helix-hairpin-helix domain-containing protein [Bacteroidales bacterium]|nr:helix-hairpin-helix domain-containing protein [Bacteroidales bacterium]